VTVDELLDQLAHLVEAAGETEGLTELDHGLQCAFELSQMVPDDTELQVAGLVHDIGHQSAPDDLHGKVGGEMVRAALGDRVAALVAGHVPAKRYLVVSDPAYGTVLSDVSVLSLEFQGGPMSDEEAADFEATPYWEEAVLLRRADDAAKVPGREVPTLDHWVPLIREVAGGAA
jgi:predicted HD phosphohydrolase